MDQVKEPGCPLLHFTALITGPTTGQAWVILAVFTTHNLFPKVYAVGISVAGDVFSGVTRRQCAKHGKSVFLIARAGDIPVFNGVSFSINHAPAYPVGFGHLLPALIANPSRPHLSLVAILAAHGL